MRGAAELILPAELPAAWLFSSEAAGGEPAGGWSFVGRVSKTLQGRLLMAAVKAHGHSSLIIHSGPLLQRGKMMLKKCRGALKIKRLSF